MRVALFHTTLPSPGRKLGGVEVAVHRLAVALGEAGVEVTVWSVTPPPDGAPYAWRPVAPRAPWLARLGPLRWAGVPLALNASALGRDADVVHLHGDDWFWFRRTRSATVRTFHGSARREAEVATNRWFRASQRAVAPLEHLSARLADLTLAVGPDAAGVLGADFVVANPVDLTAFPPGPKTPEPSVLFVGTWGGRKRGEFAVSVFLERVLPARPDVTLTLVSDRVEVDHPSVRHVPAPDDATLADLYRSAWVLLHPSTYEGFGIPYVEAMASGTAVVSSPNSGAAWVLDDGRAGVVAADDAIGDAVVDLLVDGARRRSVEAAGLARAATFAAPTVAADHLARYEEAVSRRSARARTAIHRRARTSGR